MLKFPEKTPLLKKNSRLVTELKEVKQQGISHLKRML
jgi:hypothetical protein